MPPEKKDESGQGTSKDERSLFECHPENGETCELPQRPPAPDPDPEKVPRVENPPRPKDERALYE